MTRRITRQPEFELVLEIKDDGFIHPPRESQRNWLLNRAVAEFVGDLRALDAIAGRFVPGVELRAMGDRTQADLDDQEIMEDWQLPLMQAMAEVVTASHGDILEIGFGRGIASTMIQDLGVKSHSIIECNDHIVRRFEKWSQAYAGRDLRMIHGTWQETLESLGTFDGIFFHTYPLNEAEMIEQIGLSTTFADHFFAHAASHLGDGGVFTYLSNEIDSLSRAHQRSLLRHFRRIEMHIVDDLELPDDVRDSWWSDSMVVVGAVK